MPFILSASHLPTDLYQYDRLKQTMSRRSAARRRGQVLYFAYGSNLSFDQMARRCPKSRFVGRARLYQYEFQINERGFANVVKVRDPEVFVDGLCYRLTKADEAALDRSEGVPTAYQKTELEVEFFPASPTLLGRDVTDIVDNRDSSSPALGPALGRPSASRDEPLTGLPAIVRRGIGSLLTRFEEYEIKEERPPSVEPKSTSETRGVPAKAMVYLSTRFVQPDRPWDEYIDRMELGLREALRLGISDAYVRKEVRPWLKVGKGVRKSYIMLPPGHNRTGRRRRDAPGRTSQSPRRDNAGRYSARGRSL
jgi:gamma-glutamylcyclotransferase